MEMTIVKDILQVAVKVGNFEVWKICRKILLDEKLGKSHDSNDFTFIGSFYDFTSI